MLGVISGSVALHPLRAPHASEHLGLLRQAVNDSSAACNSCAESFSRSCPPFTPSRSRCFRARMTSASLWTTLVAEKMAHPCHRGRRRMQAFSIDKKINPGDGYYQRQSDKRRALCLYAEHTDLPLQPVCAGYRIAVLLHPISPLIGGFAITCMQNGQFQQMPIAPGATYLQKTELSQYIGLQTKGDYSIEVPFSDDAVGNSSDSRTLLNFHVD